MSDVVSTLSVYDNIDDLLAFLKATDRHLPFPKQDDGIDFEWVDRDDGKGNIVPCKNHHTSIHVYRGQTHFYPRCVSSLLRGNVDQLDLAIYKIQLAEFTQLLDNPIKTLSDKIGLYLNVEALAQHYGFKTLHLDVTQSMEVAAFFACCQPIVSGRWQPVSQGEGVIYRMPFLPGLTADTVGVQIYPRPEMQLAHSVRIDIKQNFHDFPYVETFRFKHDKACGQRFCEQFKYGQVLFPKDLLYRKANIILQQPSLSRTTVTRVMKQDGLSKATIKIKLREFDAKLRASKMLCITDRAEISFNKLECEKITTDLALLERNILSRTGFRCCYTPPEA